MTIRERAIILKINEQVKKLSQAPQTSYAPQTGEIKKATEYQASSLPPLPPPLPKYKG